MARNDQTDLFQSVRPHQQPPLRESQRLHWLRLIRSSNVGPITFRELINHFGSAEEALNHLSRLQQAGAITTKHKGGTSRQGYSRKKATYIPTIEQIELEYAKSRKFGAQLVAMGEKGYPTWLQHIDAAPPLLYVMGDLELAHRPSIAIVGSRNGSAAGYKMAEMIANDLADAHLVITSGLARGIDTVVHKASIERGTIAVLAGGIDYIYPLQNKDLYHQIAEQGLLISERALGMAPKAQDFPRRNRIISGIAAATVVIEAAMRSGSLITARYATEQGRDVFAVPGNPLDPRASGTNSLLKQGASLATSAEDILDAILPLLKNPQFEEKDLLSGFPVKQVIKGTSEIELDSIYNTATSTDKIDEISDDFRETIISLLGPSPINIDELCRLSKISSQYVQIVLLELDLAGRLQRHGGQMISLI